MPPPDQDQPIVIFMTAASREEAQQLANTLVEENLAACVQLLPEIESVYRWEGKVERASEVLLIAKALQSKFEDLEERVRGMHSYDTPEIVAIPASAVSPPYLEWLNSVLK